MKVERVAIIMHPGKPQALEIGRELSTWLVGRGVDVVNDQPDLVLSLGGDGTILRAAQHAHANDAPLLGINLGTVGYLSEVELGAERQAIERIFSGDFEVEHRMMLECNLRSNNGGEVLNTWVGLNEVLVERSSRHRLVRFHVRIGGERLAAFNADGVIVATPTGSTAYALSAGGPIVSPRAECLVLVPVSPHMIFSRPFVLAPDETVEVSVQDGDSASLSLDGRMGCELPGDAAVVVARHSRSLRLVRLSGPGFIERLRGKLGLPG